MHVGIVVGRGPVWESIGGAVLILVLCDGPEQVGQGLSVHTELRSALQNALPNALSAQAEQFAGSPEQPARLGTPSSTIVATLLVLVLGAVVEEGALANAARNAFCVRVLRGRLGSGTARATGGGLSMIDNADGKDTAWALAFAAASRSAALTVSCASGAPCEVGGLKGRRPYS